GYFSLDDRPMGVKPAPSVPQPLPSTHAELQTDRQRIDTNGLMLASVRLCPTRFGPCSAAIGAAPVVRCASPLGSSSPALFPASPRCHRLRAPLPMTRRRLASSS